MERIREITNICGAADREPSDLCSSKPRFILLDTVAENFKDVSMPWTVEQPQEFDLGFPEFLYSLGFSIDLVDCFPTLAPSVTQGKYVIETFGFRCRTGTDAHIERYNQCFTGIPRYRLGESVSGKSMMQTSSPHTSETPWRDE
jgi:hypothetical protein